MQKGRVVIQMEARDKDTSQTLQDIIAYVKDFGYYSQDKRIRSAFNQKI